MRFLSKLTGGIAAAALIASVASPAAARDWRWGSPHHHHDRGPSAGAVIGAIAAVGIVAAIASAASKKKQETEQQRRYDTDPSYERSRDEDRDDDRYTDRDRDDDDGTRYDGGRDGSRYDELHDSRADQDAAVDACVVAARSEASRNGEYAEIRGVNSVSSSGSGWAVSGSVEQRSSYRATDGWQRNFRCTWQSGRVSGLSLD